MFYYCSNILEFKRSLGDILIKFQSKIILFGVRAGKYYPFIFQLQINLLICCSLLKSRFVYFQHELLANCSARHPLWWMPFHLAQSVWLIPGWMAEVFFFTAWLFFLNEQLQIDHSSHFKLTLNKSCILWHTDICRTGLVWKSFKYLITTLPISNKEQHKPMLVSLKALANNWF